MEHARTQDLLRRWIDGRLTAPEEAELETAASLDPELAAALAGLQATPEADHAAHLNRMLKRARPARSRHRYLRMAAAAAAVLLLLTTALLIPGWLAPEPEIAAERIPTLAPPSTPAPAPRRPLPEAEEPAPVARQSPPPTETEPAAAPTAANTTDVPRERTAPRRKPPSPLPADGAPAPAPSPARSSTTLPRPSPPLTGSITDEDGQPLPGVTVKRRGQALGVTTDSLGRFALPYDAALSGVEVSAEGYRAESVEVIDGEEEMQISLAQREERTGFDAFAESAARTQVRLEPEIPRPAVARPTEGYRELRERIEANRPAEVPPGRVKVSFLVAPDGTLSDFRFRGKPDRATMDYVGNMLVESSQWEIVRRETPKRQGNGRGAVRVHFKLRFK